MKSILRIGMIGLIRIYQHTFSYFFAPCCRFLPSCSAYAALSIQRFGVLEGSRLALRRILKCHPFHPGGVDAVPEDLCGPRESKV